MTSQMYQASIRLTHPVRDAREQLPVHSAYAMTAGGHYDRRWLRVHPLCSAPPAQSAVHGRDMAAWEDLYYPDMIAAARAARAGMWQTTPGASPSSAPGQLPQPTTR